MLNNVGLFSDASASNSLNRRGRLKTVGVLKLAIVSFCFRMLRRVVDPVSVLIHRLLSDSGRNRLSLTNNVKRKFYNVII